MHSELVYHHIIISVTKEATEGNRDRDLQSFNKGAMDSRMIFIPPNNSQRSNCSCSIYTGDDFSNVEINEFESSINMNTDSPPKDLTSTQTLLSCYLLSIR